MRETDKPGGSAPAAATAAKAKKKYGMAPERPGFVNKRKKRKLNEEQALADLIERTQDKTLLPTSATRFDELPISQTTLRGLTEAGYTTMTEIQAASLPSTLCGHDFLGAAKTGSGKTLAFLIPLLEVLYRHRWSAMDGLGALVLSPTRELALQLFETLGKVGKYHTFSAGVLVGGRTPVPERVRVCRLNILVATPGRLLQHMDETPGFSADALRVLVLDEADRMLDLGFAAQVDAVLAALPRAARQTLLFSATPTRSVRDLARCSMRSPVAVRAHAAHATPATLRQTFLRCALAQQWATLFRFLQTHRTQKLLVFLASCKKVRYMYATLCRMQPGLAVLHLHGGQKCHSRITVFERFQRAECAVLLATDLAARGLDFPAVHWVVQVDLPESVETYLHRVGRTARYTAHGRSLLFVPPGADARLAALTATFPSLSEVFPKATAVLRDTASSLATLCIQHPEIHMLAKKTVATTLAYLRRLGVEVSREDRAAYAQALGLVATSVSTLSPPEAHDEHREEEEEEEDEAPAENGKGAAPSVHHEDDDDATPFFVSRPAPPVAAPPTPAARTHKALLRDRRRARRARCAAHVRFDDDDDGDGAAVPVRPVEDGAAFLARADVAALARTYAGAARARLARADGADKAAERARLRAQRRRARAGPRRAAAGPAATRQDLEAMALQRLRT